jgi:hypothetical protein
MNNKWLLLILWAALTFINLNKAFHIDDTFHLEVAQWIAKNPWKPMSGFVNWYDNPQPIYSYNQPPLYFYLVALTGEVFGYSEIPLHLAQSLFTFLTLYFFYKICKLLSNSETGILLFFFAACPALVINQNLMTDVPILALVLAFIYFLLQNNGKKNFVYYVLAMLVLGAALLIKYSVLPLLVVFVALVLYENKYKYLALLTIPLGVLCIWSWLNMLEFHRIHILDRPVNGFYLSAFLKQLTSFIICIGAISPFSIAIFNGKFPHRIVERISVASLVIFVLFCSITYFEIIPEKQSSIILNVLFFLNGAGLSGILGWEIGTKFRKEGNWQLPERNDFIFITSFLFLAAFTIKYAPFIATRHILLLIPSVLFLCSSLIARVSLQIKILSVIASLALGLLLGISDWVFADFYRQMPQHIKLYPGSTAWTAGHWGWQWYSKNITGSTIREYSTVHSRVRTGDYLIEPSMTPRQRLNRHIALKPVKKLWMEPSFATFFSGCYQASMYNSFMDKSPWTLCKHPVDTIMISRIVSVRQ